ncbi:oligopeptide/dipeptide ABC transporter ATP-binding protein [Amycolatopsis sacchari]|uniref:Oligopeptide transport system ATP-binding protein n=1 Tax=Amycolatopsis sacchari TaxID=115433 RepID=A0A1I3ULR0_9PSEU|nr:oligopeptide/dipeptide ABC transporter ATP-binding protein [Amycolatopsis sacchari]SFJ83659.1 oligopeptide transport system ATP-binding protein [Amycolatopsis sacchari]
MTALLEVEGLCVDYPVKRRQSFRAVDGVDLTVAAGETLGLVGESGSGKSTIAKAILGITPVTSGTIRFDGVELDPRRVRRRTPVTDMGVVFQDPVSSLDPAKTVGYTVAEPLLARKGGDRAEVRRRVAEMLELVGLPAGAASRYPAQFSGGQRQRIAIARAFVVRPRLVICDEAVSALDLSVQAQILNLLSDVQRELGVSYLFISHDLSVVEHISDRVVVLYRGRVMETGTARELVRSPQHPYTRALLAAAPVQDPARQRRRRELRESYRVQRGPALPLADSCPYAHRCGFAVDACFQRQPVPQPGAAGGIVTCHRHGDLPAVQVEEVA